MNKTLTIFAATLLISVCCLAVQVQVQDFMTTTGITLVDEASTVEVGTTYKATVTAPEKLADLGFKEASKNMSVELTFKSDKLVQVVLPSLKKKLFIAKVGKKWELQAVMSA